MAFLRSTNSSCRHIYKPSPHRYGKLASFLHQESSYEPLLKPWNTFGIDHNAQHIVCAEDEQQLLNAWQYATAEGQPVLILGEGSNVLFLEDYRGTVIINRIKGIEIMMNLMRGIYM
ncbi:UDP-N-acetylenolpyruvoylglucosamine reductase [Escherichia coli]|uniref:UDP-N-acetylenolpyruvoylglucosamine reductase n=1 Tax=Escherichia coli TaxID=562 RepID=A0A376TN67_ECOLX|nr:UDP-N-acetylenolpyruvoylglucosamine reductase [Escherichia coli]